jgi:ATP/maltotriose-dependent transcriptional regulator MalT
MAEVAAAVACANVGDVEGATRHLRSAERSAALWEGTAWQAALLEARAQLARAQGDPESSRRLLKQAAECFETAGPPLDADRCRPGVRLV